MKSYRLPKILSHAASCFVACVAWAAESHAEQKDWNWQHATTKERAGYECSALFFILSAGTQDDRFRKLSPFMQSGGMLTLHIAGEETRKRTQSRMTNGKLFGIRDRELGVLSATWNTNPEKIHELGAYCVTWAALAVDHLQEKPEGSPDDIPFPDPSTTDDLLPDVTPFVNASFELWRQSGSVTPEATKEALRRALRN